MKQKILILTILLSNFVIEGRSRSFFTPRQISSDPVFEYGMTEYQIYCTPDSEDYPSKLYAKPFYQHSTTGQEMARYFLPCNKMVIDIRQDGLGDVCSLWLDLIGPYAEDEEEGTIQLTNYASTFTLDPVRVTYGCYLQWFMDLDRAIPHTWFSLDSAIVEAVHALNPYECGGGIGTETNIKNAYDAFNNCQWCAGKILRGKCKYIGLDDIQVKVGYDFKRTEISHVGMYGVVSIPTGNKPCACCLFEPIVGTQHIGLGVGLNFNRRLIDNDGGKLTILGDIRYRYLFKGLEYRVFDLKNNGDWSRYLQVTTETDQFDTKPIVNLLYFDTEVRPRSTFDLWLALHYEREKFNLEFGYNFWWRAKEKGKVTGCFKSGYYIYDLSGGCDPTFTCAPNAHISQSATGTNAVVSTTDCSELRLCDIDVNSAMHPSVFTNKLYAAISFHGHHNGFPTFIGVGVSGEMAPSSYLDVSTCCARRKLAFDQVAAWLILGASF